MDILTPKGQVSLFDEQVVANWRSMRGTQYLKTDKDKPAKVDAIIFQKNTLIGVAETKCRYGLTLNKLQNSFNNEWLITEEKIKSYVSNKYRCSSMIQKRVGNPDSSLVIWSTTSTSDLLKSK